MRILITLFFLVSTLPSVFAQLRTRDFPNLVVYRTDPVDPYIEICYTANLRKLEAGLQARYRGEQNKSLELNKDSLVYSMDGITQPLLTGSKYSLRMVILENDKRGKLIQFRFSNEEPKINLLNPQMGVFRTLMEDIQDIVDGVLQEKYYDEDQQANTMYLFSPKETEKNLSSYLFMYSKEPMDSTMKKLSEWLVYFAEKPQAGTWLNDSTFRIDNLRQPAFGLNETFSLTIIHSMVKGGYHQYEIYLSIYIAPGNENNYLVRPYDVQKRIWRFYNNLLFIEKSGR